MRFNVRCGTGVAWDDFDRFVETIHDTFGITNQTVTEEESMDQKPDNPENLSSEKETCFTREVTEVIKKKQKKRRPYQSSSLDILPYRKKVKLRTSDFLFKDNPKRLKFESTSASMNNCKKDILWMSNYVVNVHNLTSLWPGMVSAPNQPISNKPLNVTRNHA